MRRAGLSAAMAMTLLVAACGGSKDQQASPSSIPQAAMTGTPLTREQREAAQKELSRLRPSLSAASAMLRAMPLAERRATLIQLKCMARQSVEAGRNPSARTAELVQRASDLAKSATGGECAPDPRQMRAAGSMKPAPAGNDWVGPAATGAVRIPAPGETSKN